MAGQPVVQRLRVGLRDVVHSAADAGHVGPVDRDGRGQGVHVPVDAAGHAGGVAVEEARVHATGPPSRRDRAAVVPRPPVLGDRVDLAVHGRRVHHVFHVPLRHGFPAL